MSHSFHQCSYLSIWPKMAASTSPKTVASWRWRGRTFVRRGRSIRHFMLGLFRSIGQHFERLGRFRHIMRHTNESEFVELPTSYSPLLDDKCWIRCDVHFSRDDPSWTRHSSRAALRVLSSAVLQSEDVVHDLDLRTNLRANKNVSLVPSMFLP